MIENVILSAITICMIQYYVYTTNVIWEYLSVISKAFKSKKSRIFFDGILMIGPSASQANYIVYINSIYNNFFTKLISCPICTGFWMSIVASLILGNILYFALIAYLSLCLYSFIKILTNKLSKI